MLWQAVTSVGVWHPFWRQEAVVRVEQASVAAFLQKLCYEFSCLPSFSDVISMFDPVCFFVMLQCGLLVHTAG